MTLPLRNLIVNASQVLTIAGPPRPRAGVEMSSLGLIRDGAILVEDGRIVAVGRKDVVLREEKARSAFLIDAGGRVVLPGFVDSHAHPVFALPRLDDFEKRLKGVAYAEIARSGGGILSSVDGVRGTKEERLAKNLEHWAELFLSCGTTTLEAKSGYGLDLETELKMLRAIRSVQERTPLEIVPTFLGAHALPFELKGRKEEYVRRVCEDFIPRVAKGNLARFADVFCEKDYFTVEDAEKIFRRRPHGLGLKIHAEQLTRSGGALLA